MNHIGTLGESSLHAALKQWYLRDGDQLEVNVDGSIIDIVRGSLLIEIQTRNLASIKRKLAKLSATHAIHLIYPIAREKWIVRLDQQHRQQISRRKSPKHGRIEDVFMELVSVAALLHDSRLVLEVAFIKEEEIWSMAKTHRRTSRWRAGWARHDRKLIEVIEQRVFASPRDFINLLPSSLPDQFTNHELAHALGRPRYLAERMTYSLRQMGVLEVNGKRGRSLLFQVCRL
ncbi:MAG TPA: hypothetical protein VGK87_06190 [Anaerolineae bacterium]|jgi:hypothetical protein